MRRIGHLWHFHFLGSEFYYGAFDIPSVRLAIKIGSYRIVRNLLLRIGNPNYANLIYNDYFLDDTIDLYAVKSSLSFVDCYAATEAKVYNNKLVTFDKALAKQGGSRINEL